MKRVIMLIILLSTFNPVFSATKGGIKEIKFDKSGEGDVMLIDDAEVRAEKNKIFLRSKGVKVLDSLPLIESEKEAKLRNPKDVARRLIVLYNIAGLGFGTDKEEAVNALKKTGFWKYVTKDEKTRFFSGPLAEQVKAEAGWKIEAVWTLLWALGVVEKLDFPVKECSLEEIGKIIPQMETAEKFIKNASLRKVGEILDQADLIYRIHWATRQAGIDNKKPAAGLNSDVVVERHYALNWITFYADEWDDITCDT